MACRSSTDLCTLLKALDKLVKDIRQPGVTGAYIYFNNTIAATALLNLEYLQAKLVYGV